MYCRWCSLKSCSESISANTLFPDALFLYTRTRPRAKFPPNLEDCACAAPHGDSEDGGEEGSVWRSCLES